MISPVCRNLILAGFFAAVSVMPAAAQSEHDRQVRLADAQKIAGKVVELAAAKGNMVSVVIVNREGRVILSQRMDDASFISLKVAESKAVTAAVVGAPTQLLGQLPDKEKLSLLAISEIVTIAGGVPVVSGGKTIAGIGVSGAAAEDDHAMAEAALKFALPDKDRAPQ
ncbi:GlcG/HbpS family heme-binding protein [Sphingosinicella rhizophila]|uniref:Heme-binding protein n=1 Tax=Sphingosinicella rhizophila TaxID=3050082 RepID=A0ABU3Q604_9SPHN|nr:heme-binding protein [Sphingosinicella sp. GR2756]MDT9598837.1 heme-binding protein [Sphingosinicella sp. GR2756]